MNETKTELPTQVPPPEPISDPLYAHVIGSLEADLSAMKTRAREAEAEVARLQGLEQQIANLSAAQASMNVILTNLTSQVGDCVSYSKAVYQTNQRVYKQ